MGKAENKRKSLYEDLAKLGNFGELATQAAYNKDQVYLTWRTNGKNTCKECAKRNGKTELVGDWDEFPPLHPNCRCQLEVTKVVLAAGNEEMLSWYTPQGERVKSGNLSQPRMYTGENPLNGIDSTERALEDNDPVDNEPSLWGFMKYITGIEDPVTEALTNIRQRVAKEKHDEAVFGNPTTADFSGVESYGRQYAQKINQAGVKAAKAGEVGLQVVSIGLPEPTDALYLGLAYGGLKVVRKLPGWATFSSTNLRRNMVSAGRIAPDYEHVAHHIVAGSGYSEAALEAQKILSKFGIRPDDAVNGVFLPKSIHAPLHTLEYYRKVNKALSKAKNKDAAIEILEDIAYQLQAGIF